MGWLIALIIILLVLVYPLRIRIEASCHNMLKASLYWQPLPFLKKRPKVKIYRFEAKNPLAASAKNTVKEDEEATKTAEKTKIKETSKKTAVKKQQKTKKTKKEFDWKAFAKHFPWKKVMDKCLKTGSLEELKLHLVLIGNPFYACLGGGFLWMKLGWLLGVLSTKLKHFPAKPNINIVWREKDFEAEVDLLFMVRFGSGIVLGIYLLYIILKERKRCKNEGRQSNRRFVEYGNGKPAQNGGC
jgi:hypothetical protein